MLLFLITGIETQLQRLFYASPDRKKNLTEEKTENSAVRQLIAELLYFLTLAHQQQNQAVITEIYRFFTETLNITLPSENVLIELKNLLHMQLVTASCLWLLCLRRTETLRLEYTSAYFLQDLTAEDTVDIIIAKLTPRLAMWVNVEYIDMISYLHKLLPDGANLETIFNKPINEYANLLKKYVYNAKEINIKNICVVIERVLLKEKNIFDLVKKVLEKICDIQDNENPHIALLKKILDPVVANIDYKHQCINALSQALYAPSLPQTITIDHKNDLQRNIIKQLESIDSKSAIVFLRWITARVNAVTSEENWQLLTQFVQLYQFCNSLSDAAGQQELLLSMLEKFQDPYYTQNQTGIDILRTYCRFLCRLAYAMPQAEPNYWPIAIQGIEKYAALVLNNASAALGDAEDNTAVFLNAMLNGMRVCDLSLLAQQPALYWKGSLFFLLTTYQKNKEHRDFKAIDMRIAEILNSWLWSVQAKAIDIYPQLEWIAKELRSANLSDVTYNKFMNTILSELCRQVLDEPVLVGPIQFLIREFTQNYPVIIMCTGQIIPQGQYVQPQIGQWRTMEELPTIMRLCTRIAACVQACVEGCHSMASYAGAVYEGPNYTAANLLQWALAQTDLKTEIKTGLFEMVMNKVNNIVSGPQPPAKAESCLIQ